MQFQSKMCADLASVPQAQSNIYCSYTDDKYYNILLILVDKKADQINKILFITIPSLFDKLSTAISEKEASNYETLSSNMKV